MADAPTNPATANAEGPPPAVPLAPPRRRMVWSIRGIKKYLGDLEDRVWAAPDSATFTLKGFGRRWLQIIDRSLRGLFAHDGLTHASALTYTTLLTLVPLLAVLLAVLKGFGYDDKAKEWLRDLTFVSQGYVVQTHQPLPVPTPMPPGIPMKTGSAPAEGLAPAANQPAIDNPDGGDGSRDPAVEVIGLPEIIDKILDTVSHTNFKSLGVLGIAGLMLLVLSLLSKIEGAMNEAWAVYRSRSIARKLADYMNLLLIVLILLGGFSVLGTTKLLQWVDRFRGVPGVSLAQPYISYIVFYALVLIALFLMYIFIPNTRVRMGSALAGALMAWISFAVMQQSFVHFQAKLLSSRVKIYGAFGSVLLLLFFIYLFWCIVLWGVEVSSTHQNLRDWRRRRRHWRGLPAERETLALRLAAILARPLLGIAEPATADVGMMADRLNVPPHPVAEMLEIFRLSGLTIQSSDDCSYILSRSPETLGVLDMLRLVRQGVLAPEGYSPSARPGCEQLSPVMSQTVKDLAQIPLEQIHTFTL